MEKLNRLKNELKAIDCAWNSLPVNARNANDDEAKKLETMDLLHRYNDIKDATQIILGALADFDLVTVREMHERFNLPLQQ